MFRFKTILFVLIALALRWPPAHPLRRQLHLPHLPPRSMSTKTWLLASSRPALKAAGARPTRLLSRKPPPSWAST
jgi:hypothetical protein